MRIRSLTIMFVLGSVACSAGAGTRDAGAGVDGGSISDAGAPMDAGFDAGEDAGLGSGVDAGLDSGEDAGLDGGIDAGTDAGEGGIDAGMDAGPDAGIDAGADAGADAGLDSGGDGGVDAGTDTGVDAGINGTVDAGPDGGVDAGIVGGNDAGLDAGEWMRLDAGPDAGPDAGLDAGAPVSVDGGADAGADAGVDAGTWALGAACLQSTDCASATCDTSAPDGLCTAACATNADCGNGVCATVSEGCTTECQSASECLGRCTSGAECREDYVCDPAIGGCRSSCLYTLCGQDEYCASSGLCQSGCQTDFDCRFTAGQFCVGATPSSPGSCEQGCGLGPQSESYCAFGQTCAGHLCVPDVDGGAGPHDGGAAVDGGGFGAECLSSSDCSFGPSPVCLGPLTGADPGSIGRCTSSCSTDSDCGDGLSCVAPEPASGGRVCLRDCSFDAGCPDGLSCNDVAVVASDGGTAQMPLCAPGCTSSADCASGSTCAVGTGRCLPDPLIASDGGLEHLGASCVSDSDCGGADNAFGLSSNGNYCVTASSGKASGICGVLCDPSVGCGASGDCVIIDRGGAGGDELLGYNCLPYDVGSPIGSGAGAGGAGAACVQSSDCANGYCDTSVPDGRCTNVCETSSDCDGGACDDGICAASCTTNADCRQYFVCDPPAGACVPTCWIEDTCLPGTTCDVSGLCVPGCRSNTDCAGTGFFCLGAEPVQTGTCRAGCGAGSWQPGFDYTPPFSDCMAGELCVANECVPANDGGMPPGTTHGGFDAPCATNADCAFGATPVCVFPPAVEQLWGAAGSLGVCSFSCATDSDCGGGYSCAAYSSSSGVCARNCASDTDCPNAYACEPSLQDQNGQPLAACAPGCATDEDCTSGWTCNPESAQCAPAALVDGGFPYYCGSCSSNAECGGTDEGFGLSSNGDYCVALAPNAAGGVCGSACDPSNAGADCPLNATCVPIATSDGLIGWNCVPTPANGWSETVGSCLELDGGVDLGAPCESAADCAATDTGCSSALSPEDADGSGYCSPPCNQESDCGSGGACISGLGSLLSASGSCFLSCAAAADCPSGAVCQRGLLDVTNGSKQSVCFLPCVSDVDCRDWGIGVSNRCNTSTGVCR